MQEIGLHENLRVASSLSSYQSHTCCIDQHSQANFKGPNRSPCTSPDHSTRHIKQSLKQERNAAMLERLAPTTEGAVQSGEGREMGAPEAKAPAQKVKGL